MNRDEAARESLTARSPKLVPDRGVAKPGNDEAPAIDTFLPRIRGEYREMPGMRLTVEQAQRLWGLDRRTCENALGALIEERFLTRGSDGKYSRPSDVQMSRPQMVKAALDARPHSDRAQAHRNR